MSKWLWFAVAVLVLVVGFFLLRRPPAPAGAPAILAQVQQLNQLATVSYTVQKVVGLTEERSPVGAESILLVIQARVEAGVDLAGLQPRDISTRPDGAVVIRLPPAQILNASIDEAETRVWDRRITWWTPWVPYSLDLESRARTQGLEVTRKGALDMGILKHAARNAEASIRGLLTLAGIKTVVVVPANAT